MSELTSEIQRIFELQTAHQWVNKVSTSEQRLEKLNRLLAVIQKREQDVVDALYADLKRPAEGALGEIQSVYGEIQDAIANLEEWMKPEEVQPSELFAGGSAKMVYEARGIVLVFSAWNYPFNLLLQPVVQAISAGNCVIAKPNELSPNVSKVATEIMREAFDEKDVAVFEGGVDLSNELLELPVNHVFFTGSPAVGKVVMAAAAKHLASVTLELGGKNPVIIDRTADIQDAGQKLAAFRTMNSGQVCLCPENVYVPEESYDDLVGVIKETYQALLYKDGALNVEAQGKIINERNLKRVKGYVDDAKEKGATVVCGGELDATGLTLEPTVLSNVPKDARIMSEETFGPILNIFTYKEVGEAIRSIQGQDKPLAVYIFSQDKEFVDNVLGQTSSGGVTVNSCVMHFLEHKLPFGGVNGSGNGSYHGIHGFRELSHKRAVLSL